MLIRREVRSGSNDLHVAFRPYKIDEMLGQPINKKIIKNSLDAGTVSHTYLFTGQTGCGKTTAARILAISLNCECGVSSNPCLKCESCLSIINDSNIDVIETNLGQSGRKGDVNDLVENISHAPFFSRFKVFIMDEAHALTKASQDLLLKKIEDGYSHVYFIFCTNEPEKLTEAFINRCNALSFDRMSAENIITMLKNVCEFEGIAFNNEVISFISEEAKGIPRAALIMLKSIIDEGSWSLDIAKSLSGITLDEENPKVIELSISLLKGSFKTALSIYEKLNLPPETLRIAIAGFFVGCLKRAKKISEANRYDKILDIIGTPIYESGKLGEHVLIHRLFKIVNTVPKEY